jgi:hypothetical protein
MEHRRRRTDRANEQQRPAPGPRPESAMGGANGLGAHGPPPVASPALHREGRSPLPDDAPGDVPIERRRPGAEPYGGPERRITTAR